jgi:hypothetical protein
MKRYELVSHTLRLLSLLLICAAGSFAQTALPVSDSVLQEQYTDAVRDAKRAEAREIVNTLTPVVECNSSLVWENVAESPPRVLVTTWVNKWVAQAYDGREGQMVDIPADAYPFVTVVPEVKNFCADPALARAGLTLRLEQLLGLPPKNGKVKFVQLWVDPADLFRPCPDPEISDSRCGLDFPTGFLTVSLNYVGWFDRQYCDSYGTNGYPWTRLGYTYDWGLPQEKGHVGKSEFVIKPGSKVKICSVTPTDEYCASAQPQKCKP